MSKANVSNGTNNNVLAVAIAVVVLAIALMFFWDRQQQRAVELRRIESRIDLLEEWGIVQSQQSLQQQHWLSGHFLAWSLPPSLPTR